jgi:predicted dehydrogenase
MRLFNLPRYYTDYREAVDLPEVDVVSVCIPTYLHPEASIFALDHKKHVLCEKPIALTVKEADQMIEASRRNQRKLSLGFMRRYTPVMDYLKDLVQSGKLGRPVMYHASDIRSIRPKVEMHDATKNGGPVIDMSVHVIDIWNTIFQSKPVEVYAQGLKMAFGRPEIASVTEVAIDTATILVKYASGDVGTFVVTWGMPPGVTPEPHRDKIYGPKALAAIEWGMLHQQVQMLQEGGEWVNIMECTDNFYQTQIEWFAKEILEDLPLKVSGEDGKAALRVAEAALRSIQSGKAERLA